MQLDRIKKVRLNTNTKMLLHKHCISDEFAKRIHDNVSFFINIINSSTPIEFSRSLSAANVEKVISHKFNIIYMVTPLCASRSILHVLNDNKKHFEFVKKREPIREINNIDPRNYRIFTVVRDPFARLVSCFNKRILNCNSLAKVLFLAHFDHVRPHMSFNKFVNTLVARYSEFGSCDPHWASQVSIINHNVDIQYVDDIIPISSIDKVNKILTSFGAEATEIPMKSSSTHKDFIHTPPYTDDTQYFKNVSSTTIKLLKKMYSSDIKKLNLETCI